MTQTEVPVLPPVREVHEALGGMSGVLGRASAPWRPEPRAGESATTTDRGFQMFEGGVVYTGGATVAVLGEKDRAHRARGGGLGELGYPRASSRTEAGAPAWTYQVFENGVVYESPVGLAAVVGVWNETHRGQGGGTGALGYPLAPVVDEGAAGAFQRFERGVVYRGSAGTWPVVGVADEVHRRLGGGTGSLGYPTAPLRMQNSTFGYQTFRHGVVYTSPRGTFPVVAPWTRPTDPRVGARVRSATPSPRRCGRADPSDTRSSSAGCSTTAPTGCTRW
ncbi:LGFP repeat-containing protein [Litorihabitans aurantiacus]|uniref:LGFP repeat-containing protein n=1 Tax=Litorihabitans aurantiacus TaxID=1930061 RepID=UPI0024E0B8F9|nr:hypothetical protein [Litorihabitans aurantiacus]